MNDLDVTALVRERLDMCPNCGGGILKQVTAYKIKCETCSYAYKLQTPTQQTALFILMWLMFGGFMLLGWAIGGIF